jgi:hypothetical protein
MTSSIITAFPLLLPFPSGFAEAQKTACRPGRVRVRVTVKHYKQEEIRWLAIRKKLILRTLFTH